MSVKAVHCECDWCGRTEGYEDEEEQFEAGWYVVFTPPDGIDKCYCSFECLESDA